MAEQLRELDVDVGVLGDFDILRDSLVVLTNGRGQLSICNVVVRAICSMTPCPRLEGYGSARGVKHVKHTATIQRHNLDWQNAPAMRVQRSGELLPITAQRTTILGAGALNAA